MIFNRTNTYKVEYKVDGGDVTHVIEFRRPTLKEQSEEFQLGQDAKDASSGLGVDTNMCIRVAEQLARRIISIDGEAVDLDPTTDIVSAMPSWEMNLLWALMISSGGLKEEEKPQS